MRTALCLVLALALNWAFRDAPQPPAPKPSALPSLTNEDALRLLMGMAAL